MAIRDPLRNISKMAISRFNEVLGYFSVTALVTKAYGWKKETIWSQRSISGGRGHDKKMIRVTDKCQQTVMSSSI